MYIGIQSDREGWQVIHRSPHTSRTIRKRNETTKERSSTLSVRPTYTPNPNPLANQPIVDKKKRLPTSFYQRQQHQRPTGDHDRHQQQQQYKTFYQREHQQHDPISLLIPINTTTKSHPNGEKALLQQLIFLRADIRRRRRTCQV
jgi:hypothetical protein